MVCAGIDRDAGTRNRLTPKSECGSDHRIDALAFLLCDKLLKPGGVIELDDYGWSWGATTHMAATRDQFMTSEQEATPQVAMVIDVCLRGNPDYRPLIENRLFQRRA